MTRNRKLRRPSVKKKTRRSKKKTKELMEKNKKPNFIRTASRVAQTAIILTFLSPVISVVTYMGNQLMAIGANYAMHQALLTVKAVATHYAM